MEQSKTPSLLRQKYAENPFLNGFSVPSKMKGVKLQTSTPATLQVDGEDLKVAEIRRIYEVDAEQFVKIYVGQINSFYSLKPSTLRILTVVLKEISKVQNINGDQIYLNYETVRDIFVDQTSDSPSQSSFFRSMTELVEKGFVAPSTKPNLWFINPAIFFNGDRIKLVTEIRRKKVKRIDAINAAQGRLPLLD